MADSGIFRINPLQAWQREAILKAAQLLRDRFGTSWMLLHGTQAD